MAPARVPLLPSRLRPYQQPRVGERIACASLRFGLPSHLPNAATINIPHAQTNVAHGDMHIHVRTKRRRSMYVKIQMNATTHCHSTHSTVTPHTPLSLHTLRCHSPVTPLTPLAHCTQALTPRTRSLTATAMAVRARSSKTALPWPDPRSCHSADTYTGNGEMQQR